MFRIGDPDAHFHYIVREMIDAFGVIKVERVCAVFIVLHPLLPFFAGKKSCG